MFKFSSNIPVIQHLIHILGACEKIAKLYCTSTEITNAKVTF
jgi:hypothetical protein